MALITDHYRVHDWQALATGLGNAPDVEGDRKQGWNRFQPLDHDMRRSLVAINIGGKKNRIELFTRSRAAADEQRAWFETIAGSAVEYLTRAITDPLSSLAYAAGIETAPESEIPDDVQQKIVHDYKRKYYTGWMDEPLPALHGQSAREAVKTETGRKAVVTLLKDFENLEATETHPFDFSFLWEALGMKR